MSSKFRSSDGATYGEWQFPETAPLIFPALDKLASEKGDEAEKKQGRLAKGKGFLAEYWDKRATAEYVRFCLFFSRCLSLRFGISNERMGNGMADFGNRRVKIQTACSPTSHKQNSLPGMRIRITPLHQDHSLLLFQADISCRRLDRGGWLGRLLLL
jgi:hypothetical protein